MDQQIQESVLSKQVIEMITVAHEFCLFFEQVEKYEAPQIMEFFSKIAPLLYLKGSVLPADIPAEPEFMERFVTEEQWETVFKELREKFGSDDVYFVHDHNFDSTEVSLSDNIADIYQDMKDFVMLYQKAPLQSKACAVAELHKLFESHWGRRILQSLMRVHELIFKDSIDPDLLEDDDLIT
ncbi:MAG: DUF5063 domain-containing protein [Bacteroidota bacterium]